MIINKKLIHFEKNSDYLNNIDNIPNDSIAFYKESKIIRTHDLTYWGGDIIDILNSVYPIGSIYLSTSNVNPSILFGIGDWEQIKDTFLLASGDTYIGGETGGEVEHILTTEEMPSHAHTRGTMNITGALSERPCSSSMEILNSNALNYNSEGNAFTTIVEGDNKQWKLAVKTEGETTHNNNVHIFDASKTWTGQTSFTGNNKAHNNMPPYLVVYIWKRIN